MTIGLKRLWPFLLAPLLGCAAHQPDQVQVAAKTPDDCCALVPTSRPAGEMAADKSLFDRDWVWQDDAGRAIKLADLKGRPQVVAMYFSACAGSCGVTVSRMQEVEASLPAEIRRHTGFLLVTFDSDHDTPQVLSEYRSNRSLPEDRWTILRGDRKTTRELADALGVSFVRDPVRRFIHSAQITVLDRSGHVVKRVVGIDADLADAVNAVSVQFPAKP